MASTAWLHGSSVLRLTEGLVSVLKDQRPEHLPAVLASYREHGVLSTQSASTVGGLVGYSNAKLGSSKTRFEGLCLLSVLVKDGSSDLFEQHCLSWLRSLQQVIQSHASGQTIKLAVSILKDLLQYSSQLPELSREVGLNSILGILTSLLGLKAECELWAMDGMMACMTYYPRACGSLRDKLGAYFLTKMDCTNKNTQEMASQCYGRLPCLGGLLDRGVSTGRTEGWTNQVHCLVASANALLAEIYQGSETDGTVQYDGPGIELAFPHLDQMDPLTLLQLQHRYTAVCLALKHTLRSDPASPVRVPIRPVLNLVCRALAVSCKSINLTGDGSVRLLILPNIHTSTLEVLAALITVVRSGMVQYTLVLQRLFSQTLASWTPSHEAGVGQQRAYSSVRVSVYRTLELWVQVAGASASILQGSPVHSELLFSQLLRDIAPGVDTGKLRSRLSADEPLVEKLATRRNKPSVMGDSGGTSLPRKGDHLANQDTCLTALRALRQVILTSGALLKDDMHKRLHEVVLPLCVHLQQQQQSGSSVVYEAAGHLGGQYRSSFARRELYRLLMALVLVPSSCWPSPLTCAVSIFSKGRNDSNLKISTFCTEALTICNSLLHPRTPSTALPLPPLTLKSPPAAPVLTSTQGPGPTSGLTLPTLLGATAPGPIFPVRHSLNLGPSSLLGSLENQLSLVPGLSCPAPTPGEVILSPPAHHLPDQAGLGPAECQRPVFVRYEKEEAEDVEISLASDSDDSVVIVPPGMLNMENSQDAVSTAANSHGMLSVASGAPAVTLSAGECTPLTANSATPSTIDSATLQNNLSTSSSPLITSNNPVNSCPSSSTSLVSMVPPLNASTLTPTSGLGNSMSSRAQLQQMLMQPSAGAQPPSIAPPLQMHQLQNQLTQPGRAFHQRPSPLPTSNEDTAIININSTDDEEEEDMEDEEDVEEDEEDEDEEVSDFAEEEEEEFYDGDEYEDYDEEEAEELEEEGEDEDGDMPPKVEEEGERHVHPQEVDGDIPPLEGAEDNAEDAEGLQPPALLDDCVSRYSGEGYEEGGIEEIQSNRVLFGDDRIKVQEVESIGVLEEARADEEDESERADDPSMPQILCVTGGALEERELMEDNIKEADARGGGEVLQEAMGPWEQGASENESASTEECATHQNQQQALRLETKEVKLAEMELSSHQSQHAAAAAAAATAPDDNDADDKEDSNSADTQTKSSAFSNPEEMGMEGKRDTVDTEQQETGGGGIEANGDESKGLKRKIDTVERDDEEERSPEKKKLDDEAMASMLADFVACPPDDEDHASGSK